MAEVAPEDVFLFVYRKGEVRFTDLINEFVESHKCARQTLINYKTHLEDSKKIKKKISEKTRRPVYYVPPNCKEEAEILRAKEQLHGQIEAADPEKLKYIMGIEAQRRFYSIYSRLASPIIKETTDKKHQELRNLILELKKNFIEHSMITADESLKIGYEGFIRKQHEMLDHYEKIAISMHL